MLRTIDRGLAAISWTAAALVLVLLFAGPSLIGAKRSGTPGYGGSSAGSSSPAGSRSGGSAPAGSAVFAGAGCGSCHTLKAAGATGSTGPDLDQLRPSASTVSAVVQSGGGGMPSFAGRLSAVQIAAVAKYVASVAGR
ncbi:MAG TPA: c-type cytochrome [Solirubrobacteraceae bacterium]|nr:c-type cytochrome [Solirubrobacteraceae bacterium]